MNQNLIRKILRETIEDFIAEDEKWRGYDDIQAYLQEDEDELMEYLYLPKSVTGLKVDCFADDGGSFVIHDHPLWFYFTNSYEDNFDILPLSIEKNPKILVANPELHISMEDFTMVKQYVSINRKLLSDLGTDQITNADYMKHAATLVHSFSQPNTKITEMSKLRPEQSGLPITIWLDDSGAYHKSGHGPRIKIPNNPGITKSNTFASMTISDDPNLMHETQLPSKTIKKIKEFVINNKDLLLQLAEKQISMETFQEKLIKSVK